MKVQSFIKNVKASFHPVLFVDAGPGAPEPIVLRGKEMMEAADMVVYTGALVPDKLLGWAINATQIFNSDTMMLSETIRVVEKAYHEGHRVVWLHTGDPSPYGEIPELMAHLDRWHIAYRVLSGGSAAFEAAALGVRGT